MNVTTNSTGPSRHRVGVLGASRIVKAAVLDCAEGLIDVVAIAARDLDRAETFARAHNIARAYGSYEELISDPEIDAVYVALPCAMHMMWSTKALSAGKHVLCEKPFALSLEEARACQEVARSAGRLLMEAHHWRYHPLVSEAEEALSKLGPLTSLRAQFHGDLGDPNDIRRNPLLGPGVLMDFGCYVIQWVEWAAAVATLGREAELPLPLPIDVRITEEAPGVDGAAHFKLQFSGASLERAAPPGMSETGHLVADLSCDWRAGNAFEAFILAKSPLGEMRFNNPLSLQNSDLRVTLNGETTRTPAPGPTTYRKQLEAFCQAIATGVPPITSGENTLRTQAILDSVYSAGGLISRAALAGV